MGLAARPRRLGLFGGAFDPPHRAHVALAQLALQQLALDELRILPTGHAWHKQRPLTPAPQRLAMARLAFAELPGAVLDERETQRPGPTYTVDTLRELQAEQAGAQCYLLLGADQLAALPQWHEYRQILQAATIVLAERTALTPDTLAHVALLEQAGARVQRLALPAMPISSSMVRARLSQAQDITDLVPEPVARYIASHRLYLHT